MTYDEAKTEVYTMANTAILANIAIIGGTFDMRWPGVSKPGVSAPPTGYYGRIQFVTIRDMQSSLAKNLGQSRYEALVQLLMQVYSPVSLPGSLESGNMFAETIRMAYRVPSLSGRVFFTNQQLREVGNDDTHYITNVIVTCTYDNIQ